MRDIPLLIIVIAAVLNDLYSGKICNAVIVTGILWGGAYQMVMFGAVGIPYFLGGLFLPLLLFSGLYYFRMIGAGDIKLFCVIGSFLGPGQCFSCIVISILFGGLISLAIMIRYHNFCQRLVCLSEYINHYSKNKRWKSYMANIGADAKYCFSVPVLFAVIHHIC